MDELQQQQISKCAICGSARNITFHHLIPKTCHKNKWFKKNFTREDMTTRGVNICRQCHSYIHKIFDEKTLGRELNTAEKLLGNELVSKFARWRKKQNRE